MIHECFRHFRGVGPRTDQALRTGGFSNWGDCHGRRQDLPFSGSRRDRFLQEIERSARALEEEDIEFFVKAFPTAEHWRILGRYFHRATFIDMETTGLAWQFSHASVISAYHNGKMSNFVYGENLDDFLALVDQSELLVTFNGNSFDIPFLEKTFNIPTLGCPHVDLRWIAWHRGYRGGLKQIERLLGIHRPPSVDGIDGFEAVNLFYRWQGGDPAARDTLVRYCATDVLTTYLVAERLLNECGCSVGVSDPAAMLARAG